MFYVLLEFISYCMEIKNTKRMLESGLVNEKYKTKKPQK